MTSLLLIDSAYILVTFADSIFLTSDNGENWVPLNDGIEAPNPSFRSSTRMNDYIFVGGSYRVWRRPVNQLTTGVGDFSLEPITFQLNQNYPNPFNPTTTISFSLPQSEDVVLKVFAILGNEVAVLVNGYKSAGKHKVKFDGSNLSSGLYFYRIQAGNNFSVKKMTLTK